METKQSVVVSVITPVNLSDDEREGRREAGRVREGGMEGEIEGGRVSRRSRESVAGERPVEDSVELDVPNSTRHNLFTMKL